MEVIRYAVGKNDLNALLKTIGVLQPNETLVSVDNIDLLDGSQEVIVVTVATDMKDLKGKSLPDLTDKELTSRFILLSILENAQKETAIRLQNELKQVIDERNHRSMEFDTTLDGLPIVIDRRMSDQIKEILGGNPEERPGE